jgi:hypothetical protein
VGARVAKFVNPLGAAPQVMSMIDEAVLDRSTVTLQRQDTVVATALAIVLLACAGYRVLPEVSGIYHDDGIYVLSAKALATGHGYHLSTVPGGPAQTKYPILYPAVLSVAWRLWPSFPDNLLLLKGVSMIAAALAVAFAYLYSVRFAYSSRAVATATGLIVATSPTVHYFSTQTLSEMPFAALFVCALWTLENLRWRCAPSPFREGLAGTIIALPFLCRSAGIVVPLAGMGFLYATGRRVRWLILGAMILVIPWIAWSVLAVGASQRDPITSYYTDYIGDWISAIPSLLSVAFTNILLMITGAGALSLDGFRAPIVTSQAGPLRTSFISLCLVAGAAGWLRIFREMKKFRILPAILMAYALVIAVWPWPPERFLVPVMPFLCMYILLSVFALGPLVKPRIGRALLATGVAAVIVANIGCTEMYGRLSHMTGYPYNFVPSRPVMWSSYEQLFQWLRTHTKEGDIIACGLDSMVSLYTGRPAIRPFVHRPLSLFYGDPHPATGTVEEFRNIMMSNHLKYLVVCPMPKFSEERPLAEVIASWRLARPDESRLVYTDDDKRFEVFELLNPR